MVISYNSNKRAAEDVVAKISEFGSEALAFQADVSSPDSATPMLESVIKRFGKLDILVNNAGIFELVPVDKMDLKHYERVFDVNVKGLVATTIAALPHISEGGRIINLSSVAASASLPGGSVYSATKAAVETFTRIWAQDLGKRKITVNSVAPGATETDMYDKGLDEQGKQSLIAKTALGRVGQPEDIANLVAFLASREGGWITGQSIKADGGLTF